MLPAFMVRLQNELNVPQRDKNAHKAYAAQLAYGRWRGPAPTTAREAAVMILLYRDPLSATTTDAPLDQWQFPLTLRVENLPRHGGQISLPGGELQQGETAWQAALRESKEELGICPADVVQLGALSPSYVFVSNYRVTPFVAFTLPKPLWQPQESEVAEVFEMSLQHLIDPKNVQVPLQQRYGISFHTPCFLLKNRRIWGATSLILAELLAAIRVAAADSKFDKKSP
jgi:8-oxo-dGTP pyrophosphatase MutT (NUDIX family)